MKISPDVLRPHPLLALLPYRTIKRLAAESAVAEYPKGTVLFREGEKCDALYLIISGRCEARSSGRRESAMVEGVFGPGDILGERAFLHAEPHSYTATVVTQCALVRIASSELDQLFARDKRLAARFSQLLAKRWSLLQNWASGDRNRIRRVVSVLGFDPEIPARMMGERVAGALSTITACHVLMIRLERDTSSKRIHDWALREPRLEGEFGFHRQVSRGTGKFDELSLPVGEEEQYAAAIAPLISHCARHYEYVILQADSDLPARCFSETVLQADLAYVMIQPTDRHLYEMEMLLGSLAGRSASAVKHVRPVVIGDDPTALVNAAEAFERQERPAHFFPMPLPSEPGSGSGSRVTLYVNRLAREIARCRIGIAFSSGGAKGLAHVGVIQVLEENGIEVDAITGASMGSYVGSLWAMGLDGKTLEAIAREHEGRWGLMPVIDPVFPPRMGFIRTRKLGSRLRRHLGCIHFAQLVRPLRVVATRLGTMERVVFSRGDVADAVEASIAIPGICVPVQIGNDTLVDGGVVDPLPVDVLEEMGIERIIAVNSIPTAEQLAAWQRTLSQTPAPGTSRWAVGRFLNKHLNYFATGNVFDTMIQAFVGAQMLVAETASHRADVILRPVSCDGWWHDFTHPGRYIELGRRVAEEALPELLSLTKPIPAPANEPTPLPKGSVAVAPALRAA